MIPLALNGSQTLPPETVPEWEGSRLMKMSPNSMSAPGILLTSAP